MTGKLSDGGKYLLGGKVTSRMCGWMEIQKDAEILIDGTPSTAVFGTSMFFTCVIYIIFVVFLFFSVVPTYLAINCYTVAVGINKNMNLLALCELNISKKRACEIVRVPCID